MTDPGLFFSIAYRTHRFCNPVSAPVLDRVLDAAGLAAGAEAADLGCGNAEMAIHAAERLGLQVDAVDISPAMLALARRRLDGRGAPGRVTLHQRSSGEFLADAGRFDLILLVGAVSVLPGIKGQAAVFERLRADHLRPGGRLIYGDPFWKRPPSDRLAALLPGYLGHAGYVRAGEQAGLEPLYAAESPQGDWDDYAWRMAASAEANARAHPSDPAAEAARIQARFMRDLYLDEARDALGFGLYLFGAP